MRPFGCNRYWPKIGGLYPFGEGGAGSPSNTMLPGPRPTCVPSFILIRQTVWPQYTNFTDRQRDRTDRQRSDSIGRTVLQTVAQKPTEIDGQCKPWNHNNTSDWLILSQRPGCNDVGSNSLTISAPRCVLSDAWTLVPVYVMLHCCPDFCPRSC